MKKSFFILASLLMMAGVAMAQDQTRQRDKDQDNIRQRDRIHQEDHLMLKDGSLYQYKNGVQEKVQKQIRLKNGTVVNPDGSYQLRDRDQDRFWLRNGECLDMDGNRYLNQNKFNQRRMMTTKAVERIHRRNMNKINAGNRPVGRGRGNG